MSSKIRCTYLRTGRYHIRAKMEWSLSLMNHVLTTIRDGSLTAPEDLSTGLGNKYSKLFKYKLFLQLLTHNLHSFNSVLLRA